MDCDVTGWVVASFNYLIHRNFESVEVPLPRVAFKIFQVILRVNYYTLDGISRCYHCLEEVRKTGLFFVFVFPRGGFPEGRDGWFGLFVFLW